MKQQVWVKIHIYLAPMPFTHYRFKKAHIAKIGRKTSQLKAWIIRVVSECSIIITEFAFFGGEKKVFARRGCCKFGL